MASDGTLKAFLEAHSTLHPRLDDYLLQTKQDKLDSVALGGEEKETTRISRKKKPGSHRYKSPLRNTSPHKENIDILLQHPRSLQIRKSRKQTRRQLNPLTHTEEQKQKQQKQLVTMTTCQSNDESTQLTEHSNEDIYFQEDVYHCNNSDEKSNILSSMTFVELQELQDDILFAVHDWDPFDSDERSSFGSFLVVPSEESSCYMTSCMK